MPGAEPEPDVPARRSTSADILAFGSRVVTERGRLPDEVAAYLRGQIVKGRIRPGEHVRTEAVARALGISNTPVREGLLALRAQGFVQLSPRRGFVVSQFGPEEVQDLFWTQARLGGELAARAARLISAEQLRRLEANTADYERASQEQDRARLALLCYRFHREINLAAESQRLAQLLGSVVRHLPDNFYTVDEQIDASRLDHPRLIAVLRRGRPSEARQLMEQHILAQGQHLVTHLADRRTPPTGDV